MNPFKKNNKSYPRREDQGNTHASGSDTDKPADKPLVRAFIRDYVPAMNQEDPGTTNLTLRELRTIFCAYQSPTGFDPLDKILNQLENNGFTIQKRNFENEFVLPVRETTLLRDTGVRKLPMPENN